ncbi:Hsp20/alpha crystallin family protein [Halobellus rufus]|uniref:Hsp20/alpha crystallin family protein n=1 Tax=Halobellus rufus TaxID=1448860 RepID=UPI0006797048|nr:Hsp20/alpha crystallin family protein [Halobellus rufus]
MSIKQQAGGDERMVRRYEYEDSWVLAADVGVADEDLDVDVVGTTAIVVAETGGDVSETEFELPGSDASVATNNGILTITVEK